MKTGAISAKSVKNIQYYVERWARPELLENWPEDEDDKPLDEGGNMLGLSKRRRKEKKKNKNKK